MVSYRAILDVSVELVWRVSHLLTLERRRRGTRKGTRALSCYKQAVLLLRHYREAAPPDRLSRDNSISRATSYRYIDEGIEVLAEQAPELHEVLETTQKEGGHVIVDGKLFESDRCSETNETGSADLWYDGHKHRHGGNIQFLADACGNTLWVSDVEPGSTSDITAARLHVLPQVHKAATSGLTVLADAGYDGSGASLLTPIKRPPGISPQRLHHDTRAYNLLLCSMRGLGERAMALLTGRWRLLRHTTKSPSKIGHLTKAALTLSNLEKQTR